eukprot:15439279-Alexandrium_andersonii.AAC.1
MSASLVGSEMCIRDRWTRSASRAPTTPTTVLATAGPWTRSPCTPRLTGTTVTATGTAAAT